MADIDLAFIAQRLDTLTTEVGSMRDDMRVLSAIVLRLDNSRDRQDLVLAEMLAEIRAVHLQVSRMNDRVRKLENAEGAE